MRHNFKYGQLKDGQLQYAPNKLIIGEEQAFNAPAETYAAQGWLPVIKTERPAAEEGFYYEPFYAEQDGAIVQQWEKREVPEPEVDDAAEKAAAFDILMGVSE